MNAGPYSRTYMLGVDNQTRLASLHVLEGAKDTDELLEFSCEYFDAASVYVSSIQVLCQFRQKNMHPLVQNDERFDPRLFIATALFELPHMQYGDIAENTNHLANYWNNASDNNGKQPFRAKFGMYHKRPLQTPLGAMDSFVINLMRTPHIDKHMQQYRAKLPPADPLEQMVPNKTIHIVGLEPPLYSDVLSKDVLQGLGKLYPRSVINELQYRIGNGTTIDIIPLIEKIMQERADGILPLATEIVEPYLQQLGRLQGAYAAPLYTLHSPTYDQQCINALKNIQMLRSKEYRSMIVGRYVVSIDEYVTTVHIESPEGGKPPVLEDIYIGMPNIRMRDLTPDEKTLFSNES